MKRNGAGLASICILSTMVLVTVSSTVCMYAQTKDAVERRFPHDICMEFVSDDYGETKRYRDTDGRRAGGVRGVCGECGGLSFL